jgi:hypothetical protein
LPFYRIVFFGLTLFNKTHTASDQGFIFSAANNWGFPSRAGCAMVSARLLLARAVELAELIHPSGRADG